MEWIQTLPGRRELSGTPLGKRQQAFALELGPVLLIACGFNPNDMNGDGSNVVMPAPLGSIAFRNDVLLPGGQPGDGATSGGPFVSVLANDGTWWSQ